MKIALAQINPTIGAFDKNMTKILSFADQGREAGAALTVFPELSLVGYPPLDLLEKDHFVEDNLRALKKLASQIKNTSIVVGYIEKNKKTLGKRYHNAAALISKGKIISTHFKSLLPSYDVFDETRHFEPAHTLKGACLHRQ